MNRLNGTYAVADRYLPTALVSGPARTRLRRLTHRLPAALTYFLYFECRLAAEADQVDLVLNLHDAGRRIVAGTHPTQDLPDDLRENPVWRRLQRVCRRWGRPDDPIGASVSNVWLEFDLANDRPAAVPSVFVQVNDATAPAAEHAVQSVLPALDGHALPPTIRRTVRRCYDALPSSGQVLELGRMLPRDADAVRVCVSGLADADLGPYLEAAGWPGDPETLRRMRRIVPEADGMGRLGAMTPGLLDLDAGPEVRAPLGLEYFMDTSHTQWTEGVAEAPWWHALTETGLCTPAKRDACLQWPGYTLERIPHRSDPQVVARHLNHVKISHGPDRAPTAKAYLYLFHRNRPNAQQTAAGEESTSGSPVPTASPSPSAD